MGIIEEHMTILEEFVLMLTLCFGRPDKPAREQKKSKKAPKAKPPTVPPPQRLRSQKTYDLQGHLVLDDVHRQLVPDSDGFLTKIGRRLSQEALDKNWQEEYQPVTKEEVETKKRAKVEVHNMFDGLEVSRTKSDMEEIEEEERRNSVSTSSGTTSN
eukprot:Platyproteum_vivax@DN12829_c0_g1_i1.p1